MERERDYAYEALAECTDADAKANRGELNIALKAIREQSELTDSFLLAAEIHERAKAYRDVMPDVLLTPTALSKHWRRVEAVSQRPPRGTNLSTQRDECETCGADRFVVVSKRRPVQSTWMRERGIELPPDEFMDEYAPCPDCNAGIDTGFRRFDGSYSHPLDPARVKELIRR